VTSRCRRFAICSVGLLALGCGRSGDGVTAPASPQAADIDRLWSLSLTLGVAVWLTVMALLAVPMIRSVRRRPTEERPEDPAGEGSSRPPGAILDEPLSTGALDLQQAAQADRQVRSRLLWVGGIIVPTLILAVLLVASGRVGASTAHVETSEDVVIDVTAHMFWWEVRYPDHGVTTANEIHVPVDRPVRLRLFSDDVIHSFWVPQVHGKIDTIPGQENWLSFTPTQTGRFRGACAEFCGIAHAQMVIWLEVQTKEDFDTWIAQQSSPASPPDAPATTEGQRVFLQAGCAACHAVQGTAAVGGVGPDLTHLASRQTIASGIVPNDREHLERLILDPFAVKPGIPMPPTRLEPEELDPLLDYLESLE
jgi:cytochrome c oxidase subunit II